MSVNTVTTRNTVALQLKKKKTTFKERISSGNVWMWVEFKNATRLEIGLNEFETCNFFFLKKYFLFNRIVDALQCSCKLWAKSETYGLKFWVALVP